MLQVPSLRNAQNNKQAVSSISLYNPLDHLGLVLKHRAQQIIFKNILEDTTHVPWLATGSSPSGPGKLSTLWQRLIVYLLVLGYLVLCTLFAHGS